MAVKNSTDHLLTEISLKMDNVLKLLALNLVKDLEKQKDKIIALSEFGYAPAEISKMLNTTSGTVSVALNRSRKGRKHKDTSSDDSAGESEGPNGKDKPQTVAVADSKKSDKD
jgi:DNA-binding CsgD family transcriptional regulator